tara:strand:- start:1017 stop:1133 length:117 start_codon:yes stop_codon:yes gene_type:complete
MTDHTFIGSEIGSFKDDLVGLFKDLSIVLLYKLNIFLN